jgi:hypothetical protein
MIAVTSDAAKGGVHRVTAARSMLVVNLHVTHLDQHGGQVLGSPVAFYWVLPWLSAIGGLTAIGEFLQYRTKAQAAASRQGGTEHFGSVCDKSPRKPTANLSAE